MITPHTQKSLDLLTWNEIQKLHTSLGLKATAADRTRRDYQRRIVAAMPQPIAEPEMTVTPLTCAACPFAIQLEDNRYECGAGVTGAVTRGHWEAKSDCYEAVAQAKTEVTEPTAEVEVPIVLTTEKICTTLTAATQEVVASIPAPAPKSHSFSAPPALNRVKLQQPLIWVYVPPSQVLETIVWETPYKGEILGKNGYRPFFVDNDCIYVVLKSRTNTFCAGEFSSPNYHHKVIRQAIEAGKTFDAASFKQRANARGCPSLKYQTYWWKNADGRSCNLGQLYQSCDGWWWVWASQGDREGRKFQELSQAQNYLETAAGKPVTRQSLKNHPFRYRRDIFQGQHDFSSAGYGLCECDKCKVPENVEVAEVQIPVTKIKKLMTVETTQAIVGVLAMKEENAIIRALPFPQPRFWFGKKVVHTSSSGGLEQDNFYWQVGTVTGLNWNPKTKEWQYMVFWEKDSELSDHLGYNNDQLLMSECDLYYA